MKKLQTIFLFLSLLILSSFNGDEFPHTLTEFNLKGRVKSVTEYAECTSYSKRRYCITLFTLQKFDEQGRLICDTGSANRVSHRIICNYDHDTITRHVVFGRDTIINLSVTNTVWYKNKGNVYDRIYGNDKMVYVYNKTGRIVLTDYIRLSGDKGNLKRITYSYSGDSVLEYKYDSVGKITRTAISKFNSNGLVMERREFNSANKLSEIDKFQYDDKRNCIFKSYDYMKSLTNESDSIIYNDKYDIILEVKRFGEKRSEITTNSYEYDSKDNWIKKNVFLNDSLWRTVTRQIEYY